MEMDFQQQEDTNIVTGGDILNKGKHKIGAGKEYNGKDLMREQEVDVLGVQGDLVMGKDKYDAVMEVDKGGTGQGILNGRMVGEGIAARIRLVPGGRGSKVHSDRALLSE